MVQGEKDRSVSTMTSGMPGVLQSCSRVEMGGWVKKWRGLCSVEHGQTYKEDISWRLGNHFGGYSGHRL